MADWIAISREPCNRLVTKLSISNFNGVLDCLFGRGILTPFDYNNLLKTSGDSPGQVEDKVRSFLRHLDENSTKAKLQILLDALQEVEMTEVIQLLGQDLPSPQVCCINNVLSPYHGGLEKINYNSTNDILNTQSIGLHLVCQQFVSNRQIVPQAFMSFI